MSNEKAPARSQRYEKKQILKSIALLAKQLGHTPSLSEFMGRTGISKYRISRFFPRWNEAVRAARLAPRRIYIRPDDSELLEDWGAAVRKARTAPSRRAYLQEGKYEPRTVEKRFGSWEAVPKAFRKFAKGKAEWGDVVALLAGPLPIWRPGRPKTKSGPVHGAEKSGRAKARPYNGVANLEEKPEGFDAAVQSCAASAKRALRDRPIYGTPIHFRGLRHEPMNEQGVVLLFGMLAKELGFFVETMRTGFPDCEAIRQVGAGRWQRVNVEFEFESKNFREHGHALNGCDVIVCWRHNWDACPKHMEVLELRSAVKFLGPVTR